MKKTKIICSIGPSSCNPDTMEKMVNNGMNVARINFSHATEEEKLNVVACVKEVRKRTNMPIGILYDTKGPEFRNGNLENGEITLVEGKTIKIVKEDVLGNTERFSVNYPEAIDSLKVGDTILLENNQISSLKPLYDIESLKILNVNKNKLDGLDGLAGGIASIYFITIGIIAIIFNNSSGLDTILTFVMLGSTLGFLFHNFNPASIFMGDSGSMFLGYMIAVISLLGYKNVTFTSFIVPIFLLAIPILDTLFAIVRRTINHKPIAMPDKNHLHHQFLKKNLSQKKTVLIIYLIDLLFAAASIIYVLGNFEQGLVIYTVLFIVVLILILKTDIIFERSKK